MSHLQFQLFCNGDAVHIDHTHIEIEIGPILRFFCYKNIIFLLTTKNQLLYGKFNKLKLNLILEQWKEDILDIDLYDNIMHIIQNDGTVRRKQIKTEDFDTLFSSDISDWDEIKFQSYHIHSQSGSSIKVNKVKSNSIGTIFLTNENDIYGHGKCGDVLTTDIPIKLGKFFENQKILDISGGDDFFIVLTQKYLPEVEEFEEFKLQKYSNIIRLNKIQEQNNLQRLDTVIDMSNTSINGSEVSHDFETNETNSMDSSNKSMNTSTNSDDLHYFRIQEILKTGYSLINTSVCSFGSRNESLLGTGDHIKRSGVHPVLYLTSIGCYNISCGREHSICRTIDGRIFHWGSNTNNQQTNNSDELDYTAPKELHLNSFTHILEGCCEGYRTILCNNEVKIFNQPPSITQSINENHQLDTIEKKIFSLHSLAEKHFPIMLMAQKFTLINHISLEFKYQEQFSSMQTTLRTLLRNRSYINNLQKIQSASNKKTILPMIQAYNRMVYVLAACLHTIEEFYRRKIDYKDLLFLNNSNELIDIFDDYTHHFCDMKSVNGFAELTKQYTSLIPNDCCAYEKMFLVPFEQIANLIQFCESLRHNQCIANIEISNFLAEKNTQWQEFASQQMIETEIAENTENFWLRNSKISQIRPFRMKYRRVILDSFHLPLKLSTSRAFSSNSFILFSDCLCQYGSKLQMYPLLALWIQIENDKNLRIVTPEKSFVVAARCHEDKMLWYDQITRAIIKALGKPEGSKLTNSRTTIYTFSDKHPVYSKVRAYGRWVVGTMHGLFCLKFPDGKIYLGEIKNNEIEGYGKMIIPTTGIYEGHFKAAKFNGYGSYEMKDNTMYDGNFKDGFFHGHGTLKTNDYTYIGDFVNNVKNGYGIYDDVVSGEKYMGMFAENRKTGAGVSITIDGNYFEGFFSNDDIAGEGLAIFNNGNYYLGFMTMKGPDGKGCYYCPIKDVKEYDAEEIEEYMEGNLITGNLSGTWDDIRVLSGNFSMNKKVLKFPRSVGDRIVDNHRKWRTLFDNWEEHVFGSTGLKNTKQIWNKIVVYIMTLKDREKTKEQNNLNTISDFFTQATINLESSYIKLNQNDLFVSKLSNSLDLISISSSPTPSTLSRHNTPDKSLTSLTPNHHQSQWHSNRHHHKRSYSNELIVENVEKFDQEFERFYQENLNNFLCINQFDALSFPSSSRSSSNSNPPTTLIVEEKQTSTLNYLTNNNNSIIPMDIVPDFGIESLNSKDVTYIKQYLEQAFKDQYHPLSLLNQRISNAFYSSYGCWRIKPNAILAYQAIKEWESISSRVYIIVRKLFPSLPADRCEIEETGEIISHISLLYPILLSEGIYSTLLVLYANKHRQHDEIYRQRIMLIEKTTNEELISYLCFEKSLINIIETEKFNEAISTLKQITEECSPKGMLDLLEKSIELINDAHKQASESTVISIGGADNIVPLTLLLVLRANVPHLGAELALLDDLTGEANHELNLNGLSGYCFTTIKAAYEHIVKGNLFDTLEQNYFLSHRRF